MFTRMVALVCRKGITILPFPAPAFDIFLIKTLQDANFGLNMNERFEGGKRRKEKRRGRRWSGQEGQREWLGGRVRKG